MITIEIIFGILFNFLVIFNWFYTIYQEHRHKKDNGTLKPKRNDLNIDHIKSKLTILKDHVQDLERNIHILKK